MGHGAQEDKDVPDGVEMLLAVVGEEISAGRVKHTLSDQQRNGQRRELRHDGLEDQQHTPAHHQINRQRETGKAAHGEHLVEDAPEDGHPLHGEDGPAQPAAHNGHADRRVGAGNHDVDANVVEDAHDALRTARMHPMIGGAQGKHDEHADDEKKNTESHLPAVVHCWPHHPDGREGKNGPRQVGDGVGTLGFDG